MFIGRQDKLKLVAPFKRFHHLWAQETSGLGLAWMNLLSLCGQRVPQRDHLYQLPFITKRCTRLCFVHLTVALLNKSFALTFAFVWVYTFDTARTELVQRPATKHLKRAAPASTTFPSMLR